MDGVAAAERLRASGATIETTSRAQDAQETTMDPKDIEDINGDQNAGRRTLPIVLGIERTEKITVAIGLILVLSLGVFVAMALSTSVPLGIHLTLALLLAIWMTYKSAKIERPSQAKSLSLTLKLLLILGLLSLFWL